MRIIAGNFRGRRLKSPPNLKTRPTSDRLRETLFNVLSDRVEGARLLDLCAGAGAIGIEALSRNSAHVTFVERSRQMGALIKANLEMCRVTSDQANVVTSDAREFLNRAAGRRQQWDIVYFDPPYADDYAGVLALLGEQKNLVSDNGIVIAEHDRRKPPGETFGRLHLQRRLKQGDSMLSFYAFS